MTYCCRVNAEKSFFIVHAFGSRVWGGVDNALGSAPPAHEMEYRANTTPQHDGAVEAVESQN
jgi:hypothetical protein